MVKHCLIAAGKQKGEAESGEGVSDTNSYAGIRSTNAPSLGASRKGSMFDVGALDTTRSPIPEEESQREDCKPFIFFFLHLYLYCSWHFINNMMILTYL